MIAIYARRALWFRVVFFACAVLILLDTAAVSAGTLDRQGAGLYLAIGLVVAFNAAWIWFRRCPRCGTSFGRSWVITNCPACAARLIPPDA